MQRRVLCFDAHHDTVLSKAPGNGISLGAMHFPILASLVLATILSSTAAPAADTAVDLALVLAVDTSGSVDGGEYALQMDGIAAAFRSPDVIAAALSGPHGKIAINLMTWGDPDEKKYDTGWHVIASKQDAEDFAKLANTDLPREGGGTGIGIAMSYGIALLRHAAFKASRQVIDVSGDGHESWELREPHFKLPQAQALRAAAGVLVNGLAIVNDEPNLEEYYRNNVIGGPGSFVISVANYGEYAEGIHRKLLREILPPLSMLEIPLSATPSATE
ncbi:DUF1194 domain-containing protein [Aestuariivirga litoralis]|uniref:DUF1194 domain-containing protein n=1 Tax=Aestuariivirga litoralis TaxID=2650924 RepID=UPI0018C682D0|nr:DUF1194 domain-containing protein [Aestuariivirga litoralis]MBG1232671.1 DUF1194 domain-containing protein [Aestuariivirga litoralis]